MVILCESILPCTAKENSIRIPFRGMSLRACFILSGDFVIADRFLLVIFLQLNCNVFSKELMVNDFLKFICLTLKMHSRFLEQV